MSRPVVTRFAPSPTGMLHIGGRGPVRERIARAGARSSGPCDPGVVGEAVERPADSVGAGAGRRSEELK